MKDAENSVSELVRRLRKSKRYGSHFSHLLLSLRAEEAEVRCSAALALGKWGDVRAVRLLVNALEDDRVGDVRQCIVIALGEMGHPSAIPALVEALEDCDAAVTEAAATALTGMTGPVVPALIEALIGEPFRYQYPRSPPKPRRCEALAALLGQIGNDSAIVPLIQCLNARDAYLAFAAAEALQSLMVCYPLPELRSALPPLVRWRRQGWRADFFGQVIRQIEAATELVKHLPLPAQSPALAAENLPLPASPPPPNQDRFPVPASAPADERSMSFSCGESDVFSAAVMVDYPTGNELEERIYGGTAGD